LQCDVVTDPGKASGDVAASSLQHYYTTLNKSTVQTVNNYAVFNEEVAKYNKHCLSVGVTEFI